jgi:receptor kinase-like protein
MGTNFYPQPLYWWAGNYSTRSEPDPLPSLILETVTGKRPTDSRFRQGLSIREYVDLALQKEVVDAVDTRLSLDLENELHTGGDSLYKKKMDCVFSLLELGMSCTQELPSSRMSTGGIIKEMLAIKDSLLR